jgi:hypothetical protein
VGVGEEIPGGWYFAAVTIVRVACKLYEARPRIAGGASPGSEVGILMGQFSRRRGHMPIRKLMSLCGGLIRRIKPCFMMSLS